jgi:predicted nucleotidyltransferase
LPLFGPGGGGRIHWDEAKESTGMTKEQVLSEIKARLQARHGTRLQGLVLYGSEARGDAGPDSDIDLLVLLTEPVDYGRDLEGNLEALHPLSLQLGRRISAKPVAATEYQSAECPLYRSARLEGIAL